MKPLIDNNPVKIEDSLIKDWETTSDLIDQLWREYERKRLNNFNKDRFYTKRKNALEKVKWLENKVENYYMCNSPGRWKYRITAIPAVVKGWFE